MKKSTPAKVVFDKTVGPNRLKIEVDRHNWNVFYGKDGKYFEKQPSHFSNFAAMLRWLNGAVVKSLTTEMNPAHIQRIVTESENYLVDLAGEIKQLFADSAFATPEQRHEEQNIKNKEK